jgi:RNA polymerase sigma-70 factor (ECF subfamily)
MDWLDPEFNSRGKFSISLAESLLECFILNHQPRLSTPSGNTLALETSVSLLDSLKPDGNPEAWARLVELYGPLIRRWLIRHGAKPDDVEDITQDVLAVVVRRLPEFRHEHAGAFRGWLRAITANCVRDFWRKANRQPLAIGGSDFGQFLKEWEDPKSALSQLWNREHDEHVARHLIEKIQPLFSEKTWAIFNRFALQGHSADEVAREFKTTPNAVFIAKSRVMSKFRQLSEGLLD